MFERPDSKDLNDVSSSANMTANFGPFNPEDFRLLKNSAPAAELAFGPFLPFDPADSMPAPRKPKPGPQPTNLG